MRHESFDVDYWIDRYPLSGFDKLKDVSSAAVTGPIPFAYVEQIRREVVARGDSFGDPQPADLFVWNLGDSPRRDITKIGGTPFWPADEDWPEKSNGDPATFLAQISFVDSGRIFPNDDHMILVLFADDDDGEATPDYFWLHADDRELMPQHRIPKTSRFIEPCHAQLYQTVVYPNADFELLSDWEYPVKIWARGVEASCIGGAWTPHGELIDPEGITDPEYLQWIREAEESMRWCEKSFMASLKSIEARHRQPFINVECRDQLSKQQLKSLLMIGDVGGLDIFADDEKTSIKWY